MFRVDYALFKESIKNIHVFDYMLDDKKDDSVYSFINSLDIIYERAEIAFDDDIDFYLKNGYLSTESNIRGIIEEKKINNIKNTRLYVRLTMFGIFLVTHSRTMNLSLFLR
ncbi:hypothetical protein [Escherichia coli]|uniref:hypothetical protein n=1 Tax=Escherichia coli TaxID=562 RepID=UPI0020323F61|nr:hypothetical protein [Escherichia coli]